MSHRLTNQLITKLWFNESIGNEVTVRRYRGCAALESMVTATDYYTKAPRRSWSSTPAHIYQVLLHIIFFVLLRTYHVASAAHIKLLTLNSLGRKKTNTLRKAARAPLPPPGHLLRQLLAWYNGNCALNTIFQF